MVRAALSSHRKNGTIGVADVGVAGTPVAFATSTASYTTVDVRSLLTTAVVSSGWAGLSVRSESSGGRRLAQRDT